MRYNIDMVVYVELVLFNNIAINLLILYIANILCGHRQVWWRLILSALIGAGYALVTPLINLSWEIVIKLALSLLMCIIMTNIANFKPFCRYVGSFYIITFLLGGSVLAFSYMSVSVKEAMYSPLSVIFGAAAMAALVLLIGVKFYIRRRNVSRSSEYVVTTQLKIGGKIIQCSGLLDSGNRLYYKGIYPVIAINDGIIKLAKPVGTMRVVTANGTENQALYAVDYCLVGNKKWCSIYAIVSRARSECDVILHSSML